MVTDGFPPSRIWISLFAVRFTQREPFRFLPPATGAELWGGLALIALSVFGAVWVTKCRADALALEQDSVIVEGKVLRLWVTTGKGSARHVAYEYPASPEQGARRFYGETTLAKEHFDRLKEGKPLIVKVCRTDAANHEVAGQRPRVFARSAALVFSLSLLAVLALAGSINLRCWWICHQRNARLLKISEQVLRENIC